MALLTDKSYSYYTHLPKLPDASYQNDFRVAIAHKPTVTNMTKFILPNKTSSLKVLVPIHSLIPPPPKFFKHMEILVPEVESYLEGCIVYV